MQFCLKASEASSFVFYLKKTEHPHWDTFSLTTVVDLSLLRLKVFTFLYYLSARHLVVSQSMAGSPVFPVMSQKLTTLFLS